MVLRMLRKVVIFLSDGEKRQECPRNGRMAQRGGETGRIITVVDSYFPLFP